MMSGRTRFLAAFVVVIHLGGIALADTLHSHFLPSDLLSTSNILATDEGNHVATGPQNGGHACAFCNRLLGSSADLPAHPEYPELSYEELQYPVPVDHTIFPAHAEPHRRGPPLLSR